METTINEKIISLKVVNDYEEGNINKLQIETNKGTVILVEDDSTCLFGAYNFLVKSEGELPEIGDTLYAIEIEGYFLKLKTDKGYITFTTYSEQRGGWYSRYMKLIITKNGKKTTSYITGELQLYY